MEELKVTDLAVAYVDKTIAQLVLPLTEEKLKQLLLDAYLAGVNVIAAQYLKNN